MIDEIITDVLKAEGWDRYTNDPADRGGPTKWGITLRAWQDYRGNWTSITAEDIKVITESQARDFYEQEYVLAPRFNQLPERLQAMVIDAGVNHGVRIAAKWVQRSCGVKQDGLIGPKTLQAVSEHNPISLYSRIIGYRVRLYGRIVRDDRTQARFVAGWMNRAAKWLDRLADSLICG